MNMNDSFGTRSKLTVGGRSFEIFRLNALTRNGIDITRLPYSLRILLEDLLRTEDGVTVTRNDIEALAGWSPANPPLREIAFTPARVLLQDFTGVPAVVDLAAMRDAMAELGGDPARINPLQPVELVVDHSVQVDAFGTSRAFLTNVDLDYQRNRERYQFLRWGQRAFDNFRVVPPNTGIVHQVNLEYLARVVFTSDENPHASSGELPQAYPDTLVGTDSHTPMINGLGVLGWGVGGIEAEAAMLGQPVSMLIPEVIGFRLEGRLPEGATATDLVLTVTELLRRKGVVGKFVEFYGPGLASLALADRATIGNMSPEYGATCAIFPVDEVTLQYLRFTGRSEERVALVEAYMKEQGLFHTAKSPEPVFTDTLTLDLSKVEPSIAGPRRPQDRIRLSEARRSFRDALPSLLPAGASLPGKEAAKGSSEGPAAVGVWGEGSTESPSTRAVMLEDAAEVLDHGSVVIAAITSCTNTSNPSVMLAAGLLAKKAVERGLERKPWVKTSLAPGSKVVMDYYDRAGLTPYLDQLGFNLVGYGCTTCIGNSGPLPIEISEAIQRRQLVACSVLSGNRNFEGRINSDVRANYLMSPPLVVAFALAGRIDIDLSEEPLGHDSQGNAGLSPGHLAQLGRSEQDSPVVHPIRYVPQELRRCLCRRRAMERRWRCPRATASSGPRRPPMSGSRPTSKACRRRAPHRWTRSGARESLPYWATASPPTTSRLPGASRRIRPRGAISSPRALPRRTSTRTAPAAATMRSWSAAPLPIPESATGWRRVPRAASPRTCRPARSCRSTTPRCGIRPRRRRCWCWPGRNTAPAPAGTGRPRARPCRESVP